MAQNEIPAGSKVQVAMTQKGVTTLHDAEVLAHMDGLVHVNVNGEAVSVDPSQIVMGDAPVPAVQGSDPADVQLRADLLDDAHHKIDFIMESALALAARVTKLEKDFLDLSQRVTAAATAAPALPSAADLDAVAVDQSAAQETSHPTNEDSTAAAASGDTAAGS